MNLRMMRLMRLHRLMDKAGDGSGAGEGSGGGNGGGAGEGGSGDGSNMGGDAGAGDDGKGGGEGDEGGKGEGNKPSDAEAKLLREVMDKKTKLRDTETQLAQVKEQLKKFEGIDPEAVRKLLGEKAEAERKKLEEKGNWDALRQQMNEAHEKDLKARDELLSQTKEQLTSLQSQIAELTVGNAFGQSKFIHEELVLTPSKTRQVYGSHFEFNGEQIVAYDKPIGAKTRTMLVDGKGDPLSFEAAMKKLVELDPDRDQLLKSKARQGAGSRTDNRGSAPEKKTEMSARDRIAAGLKGIGGAKK